MGITDITNCHALHGGWDRYSCQLCDPDYKPATWHRLIAPIGDVTNDSIYVADCFCYDCHDTGHREIGPYLPEFGGKHRTRPYLYATNAYKARMRLVVWINQSWDQSQNIERGV